MSTLTVAKKDFKATRRTKTLWIVALLLTGIAALFAYVYTGDPEMPATRIVKELFSVLALIMSLIIPIVALTATYLAVAGERDSGGIKFLLALPNSRGNVVFGKLCSRLLSVGLGILLMYAVAAAIAVYKFGTLPVGTVLGITVMTLVFTSVYVSVAIAMSSAVASRTRAIAGAFVVYFVTIILYIFPLIRIRNLVTYAHQNLLGMEANVDLYNFVEYTSPFSAFRKALNLVLPTELHQTPFLESARNTEELRTTAEIAPELPIYLTSEFSLVIFAAWFVLPLTVGYLVFNRTDLA